MYRVVVGETDAMQLTIRDVGEGNDLSVTNDAENVLAKLWGEQKLRPGMRLFYYESEGDRDEILFEEKTGKFQGFGVRSTAQPVKEPPPDVQHLQDCLYAISLAVKNDEANKGTPLHRHIERILSTVPKTPAQTSLEMLFEAMGVDIKQAEKLAAIDVITKSAACDLRKLQNIAGVIDGTFQPEYFINPGNSAHPGDGLGGAS